MLLPLSKIDSKSLLLVSKLFLIGGACLALVGAFLTRYPGSFAGLEALAFLAIFGGYLLRKKANAFRRRFEWRDGHVPA